MGQSSLGGYGVSATGRRLSTKKKKRLGHQMDPRMIAALLGFADQYGSAETGASDPARTTLPASAVNAWNTPAAPTPPGYTRDNIGAMSAAGNALFAPPGGGGGGAVAGAGSALDPATGLPMQDWTGFASRYAGGPAADFIESNPEIFIRDMMKEMGFNPDEGLMDMMEQYAENLPWLAYLGLGTGDPNSYNPGDIINLYGQFTKDMMTPGKGTPDPWKMVQSVLDAPKGSPLDLAITQGNSRDQAAAVNNLIMSAFSSMPPTFQRAVADMLEDKTTDWLASKAKGTGGYKGFLSDWLQKGGKGLLG
jgi:hypothetical protein